MADLSIYALTANDFRTYPRSLIRSLTRCERKCEPCNGSGYEWAPGGTTRPCATCHGAKEIERCIECGCDLPCSTHGEVAP